MKSRGRAVEWCAALVTKCHFGALQAAIANAQTLAEVERLETALKTGIVPSGVTVRLVGTDSWFVY